MDSRQSATGDKRKRGKKKINPADAHGSMEIESNPQNDVNKHRKQEMDPLKMGHILEKIFSFLDADSIKAARQVDPLWSIEGAKSLIAKCYIKIPSELQAAGSSKKKTKMDKFKLFLSHKSKDFPVIPNIIVGAAGDVEQWQSLGVLGQKVKCLKLKYMDDQAQLLRDLLNVLPKLEWLTFRDFTFRFYFSEIINVLVSTMSEREKDGHLLTISSIVLEPDNEEELMEIEKLLDCKNIMVEELVVKIQPSCFNAVPNVNVRISTILSKLLSTSQNVLKRLTVYNSQFFLSLLEFPCMPALTQINLSFWSQASGQFNSCKFSPTFRFSEKVPNLQEINVMDTMKYYLGADLKGKLKNLLENTGTAPSVKRVTCFGKHANFDVDALFKAFPNTEDLQVSLGWNSKSEYMSIWKNGKNLKKLALHIHVLPFMGKVGHLDANFTGHGITTVFKILKTPNLDLYTLEELEELRVYPSILNLKELEHLTIYGSDIYLQIVPKRVLSIAAKYQINRLPKNPKVFIKFENTRGFKKAFEEVAKLPNFTVEIENDMDLNDRRFEGFNYSDSD